LKIKLNVRVERENDVREITLEDVSSNRLPIEDRLWYLVYRTLNGLDADADRFARCVDEDIKLLNDAFPERVTKAKKSKKAK
jgi:hypothetical protein